jgi:signal transduction histidine kinase
MVRNKIAHFSSDGQLLSELGERLIATPEVALAELIKNAYDADATKAHIWLEGFSSSRTLNVFDTGVGMTEKQFLDCWMTIASTSKLGRDTSSKFGRLLTGAKGVGRFAARLLGTRLHLETTAYDSKSKECRTLTADFDWNKFAAGQDVTSVDVPYRVETIADHAAQGTHLRIDDLQTDWSEEQLRRVTHGVYDIVSLGYGYVPPASKDNKRRDPGFALFFSQPGVETPYTVAGSELYERALSRVAISVRGCRVTFDYEYENAKPRSYHSRLDENLVGNVHAEIRYFPKRAGRFLGLRTIDGRKAQKWLREKGGVRVIDRGFRLLPYGEPDDDWLQLSAAKAVNAREWGSHITKTLFPESERDTREDRDPLLKVPANHQLLGAVFVQSYRPRPDEAPSVRLRKLQPAMDRQGFVENSGFEQLQHVVRAAVELFAVVDVDETLKRKKREARARTIEVHRQIERAINQVRADRAIAEPQKREIIGSYKAIAARVKRMDEASREARRAVETLSLLGVLAGFMTHEVTVMLRAVERMLASWEAAPQALRGDHFEATLQATRAAFEQIKSHLDYAEMFISDVRKGEPREFKVRPQVDRVKRQLERFTRDRGIDTENNVPESYALSRVPVSVCSGVLMNLYTNAIKAVLAVRGARARRIRFDVLEGTRGGILVSDNGVGIPDEIADRIFEPLFSTSAATGPLGTSMGLGLYIVKRLLGEIGGSIEVTTPPEEFKTAFLVRFER